jgi:hypothetical protein
MIVAFRLVSYAQAGVPVSKASLMQNIQCRLPVLMDDDDEDDLPPPQPPQQQNSPQRESFEAFKAFDQVINKHHPQQ